MAVETLAAELGATKGSFYWHFRNRDAVVAAALEFWERRRTEAVIERLEREPDPARRLRALLVSALELGPTDRTEVVLLAHPGHPLAVAAVRRVAERRVAYIARQLEALGHDPQDALDRALLLHHVYAGYLQMSQVAPDLMTDHARRRHLELLLDAVVGGGTLLPGTPTRGAAPDPA